MSTLPSLPLGSGQAWHLQCSACDVTESGDARATVCPKCGQPFLVRYDSPWPARTAVTPRWDMWRYAPVMPLKDGETPVSLGEGLTPLQELPKLAAQIGGAKRWVKDEGRNPTASFKARGMSAAVTRAKGLGVPGFVVPTAGNAGAAEVELKGHRRGFLPNVTLAHATAEQGRWGSER